jgi:endonuclease IV
MIFVSTTYYGAARSELHPILRQLEKINIDGIEIGSNHKYQKKDYLKKIINTIKKKRIIFHNFFPPTKNENFVLNITSSEKRIRENSVEMIIENLNFCKNAGGELYTFHPGFLSDAKPSIDKVEKNYDFKFGKNLLDILIANTHLINSLKKIVNYASSKKIKIAIETEGSRLKKNYLIMQKPIEFEKLFKVFPKDLYINFNIAHSYFASKVFNFSLIKFIKKINSKVAAVELSCNDSFRDQHLPINSNSKNLNYVKYFKNIPIILEFRNTNFKNLKKSINILKNYLKKND